MLSEERFLMQTPEWADTVAFDEAIRRWPTAHGPTYLHYRGEPLKDLQPRVPEARGQLSLFGDGAGDLEGECGGYCGV